MLEERRETARRTLQSALSHKKKVTPQIIVKTAEIEVALYEKHKRDLAKYNKHVRSLWHNLGRNKGLRDRVLKSQLTGEKLCELNPRDLATEDEKLKREKLRKNYIEEKAAIREQLEDEDEDEDEDSVVVSSERKSDDTKGKRLKEQYSVDDILKYTTYIWDTLHKMRNGHTYQHEDMDTVAVELLAKLCCEESTEKDIDRYYSLNEGWNIVRLQHDIYLSGRKNVADLTKKAAPATLSLEKNADAIQFLDCDGTKISFRIEMRKMKEIMNGYVTHHDVPKLTIWSDQGIINDGTSEVIRVVARDRDRVKTWLEEHRGKSLCKIEFRSNTYVESSSMDMENEDDDVEYVESKTSSKKRKRKKKGKDDRVWKTYYTIEDNETLYQISKDFGGSPTVQELIDANIDNHPMITATSLLHKNTAIFIEPIDPNVESRVVNENDVIFVRWPQWGGIWYECVVSEGSDVPWVVDSAPDAEPMFSGGPYVFWPGGKDMDTGKVADHEWAWHIPTSSSVDESANEIKQKKDLILDERKTSKRKIPDNEHKKKRRNKRQKVSKIETAGQKLPFNGCAVEFYFRDKEHGVEAKTSALRREDLDFNLTVHEICETALKCLRLDTKVDKSKFSIYTLSEENLERFRKFHVIFKMHVGSNEKVIGQWKAKNASSLQRKMYSIWDQCVDAKYADKAKTRDVEICFLLSYTKAALPSLSIVRRVSAKKLNTTNRIKIEARRREAQKIQLRTKSVKRGPQDKQHTGVKRMEKRNPVDAEEEHNSNKKKNDDNKNNNQEVRKNGTTERESTKLVDLVRQLKAKISSQKRSFTSTMKRLNAQKETFRMECIRLKKANALSLRTLQKNSTVLSAHFEEKFGNLYGNIEMLREALKIDVTKRRYWMHVGPGDDDYDDDDDDDEPKWQMVRSCPTSVASFFLDKISKVQKFQMLHAFYTTFKGEEKARDEGGVTRDAVTISFSETALPLLEIGMKDSTMPLFVRQGSTWMPNANLVVKLADLSEDGEEFGSDKVVPLLNFAGLSSSSSSSSSKVAIIPLSRERRVLHQMILSMNDKFWCAGVSSTGKVETLRQNIKNWPLVESWCKCRWYEAIGRLFGWCVINFHTVPSELLPDIVLDFLMDCEPSMETKVPLERVLRHLDNAGIEWVRSAYESENRNLAEEVSYADEDLAEKIKQNGGKEETAVRVLAQEKLINNRREALEAMKRGFHLLPVLRSLYLFDFSERRKLVSGTEQLSARTILNCVVFENFPKECMTPKQFELLLSNWEKEDFEKSLVASGNVKPVSKLKMFLQFVTGTIAIQHSTSITIEYEDPSSSKSLLPTVQTCTNTMQLRDYSSVKQLKTYLEIAIQPENMHMEDKV